MGPDLGAAKAAARKAAYQRRKAAHSAGAGARACRHLTELLAGEAGRVIAGYMPIRTEVDILPAMTELAGANTIGVPVIRGPGQALDFHRWQPGAAMIKGPFGAQIPVAGEIVIPDIVILPLVAFDARGYRLGYGGGFYDRTLEKLRAAGPVRAIGLAYAAQAAQELPIEATDQPMDAVVTECGVTTFGA